MNSVYSKVPVQFLLRMGAFLFPLFFMYGPFNGNNNNRFSRQIWAFIIAGLIFELVLIVMLLFVFIA